MRRFILPVLMALGLATPGPVPSVAAEIDDSRITDAVERELLHEPGVHSNRMDIETRDGIVTLSGTVSNLLAKEQSVRVAETVKGVRAVIDRMQVKPFESTGDRQVRQNVLDALRQDPATDSYEVEVTVHDGTVALSGEVQSWAEKRLCTTVVQGVEGVLAVQNDIHIDYRTQRTDGEIRSDIEQTLKWSTMIDHALVDVAVSDGRVRLTGTVGSSSEKRRARQAAWTAGVHAVDDADLEVARWTRETNLRQDKYDGRPDAAIQQAIEDALVRDPRVFSFNVAAEVHGGIVTLRGQVDNLRAKRSAEQVARNTVGAVHVENHLKVRPAWRDDDAIESDLRDAMQRSPYFSSADVEASSRGGDVYLSGTVSTNFEKSLADDIASRVNGVVSVSNNLEVELNQAWSYSPFVDHWATVMDVPWSAPDPVLQRLSDTRLRENIESELWWSPFVDSEDISVEVKDGVATLSGIVDTRMEWDVAQDNAYEGGATFVRNRLRIDPDSQQASR